MRTCLTSTGVALVVALLIAGVRAPKLAAQTPTRDATAAAVLVDPWLEWRPLAAAADNPRSLLPLMQAPDLLLRPSPKVGLATSAGLASGLPDDIESEHAAFTLSNGTESGAFRRPLDPERRSTTEANALAWQPLGDRAAAIGSVSLIRSASTATGFGTGFNQFGSTPFVVTDTSNPNASATRAQLQGALGWRRSGWRFGAAAGIDMGDGRTEQARFPRFDRLAAPAASVSMAHGLLGDYLRAGLQARWLGGTETITLVPRPGGSVVYPFDGYSDPDPRTITQTPGYFRRLFQRAFGYRAALSGGLTSTSTVRWSAFAERQRRNDRYWSLLRADPPTDHWDADGWYMGGDAQWRSPGERMLLTVRGRQHTLDGHATRADLQGDTFRATERLLDVGADARWRTGDSSWAIAAIAGTSHELRTRNDYVVQRATRIDSWAPSGALEVAHSVGGRTSVSAGVGVAQRGAVSVIPTPAALGPVYQSMLAPEIATYASGGLAASGALTLVHRFAGGNSGWVRFGAATASPQSASFADAPIGNRREACAAVGVILDAAFDSIHQR